MSAWHIFKGSDDNTRTEPFSVSVFIWFAGALVYVFALGLLGFYVATIVGVTLYSFLLRDPSVKSLISSFILAAICVLIVHLIFVEAMNVSLPTGFWG